MNIHIQTYQGEGLTAVIGKLSEFRLHYFREYPYLYVGTEESEQKHLAEYIADSTTRLILVRDRDATDKIVGIAIGTMLPPELKILLETIQEQFFYFGEMIFIPEYRHKGLGKQTLDRLKEAGRGQGARRFCFLAVDRESNDIRRPADYIHSDTIFHKFGFEKTDVSVQFNYPTLQADGSIKNVANCLSFWIDQ